MIFVENQVVICFSEYGGNSEKSVPYLLTEVRQSWFPNFK